jgi:ferredoxin
VARKPYSLWPRASTRSFVQEARHTPRYSVWDWLHGYVYARWPYLYIGIAVGEHPLARYLRPLTNLLSRVVAGHQHDTHVPEEQRPNRPTFADTYHGKVVPPEAARRLVTVNQEVHLTDLETVIPYAMARDIVLHHPDHIVVLDCPCRAVRSNPCLPLDVCLIVGEPFASFVAEHHPRRSRWITPQQATEILDAEHQRGHVHHAFFKDAMLGRFYAICNCCSCCCGAMQAQRQGVPMLASSGYISQISAERCVACGACVRACPFGALSIDDGRADVNVERCMGCGVCISRCEREALVLVRDPSKGEPLELDRLMANAAGAEREPAERFV